jgi:integrase/recombinase XerC
MSAGSESIEGYLSSLQTERGYSSRTLASYRIDLAFLLELAASRPWRDLSEHDIRRWLIRAARGGLGPRSIARRLSCWRGFFDWLSHRGLVSANPARGVRAPKPAKRLPKALSPDSAMRLAQYAPDQRFESIRNKALLELFYSSGLRLSELTSLDQRYTEEPGYRSASWIDLDQAEATVLGKGNKKRTVPIGSHARIALSEWLATRDKWLAINPRADSRALFLSVRGARLANRTVQTVVKQLALTQGIPANVHPHVLRHSFASHLLQSSGDLRAVQELLGHASIATTQVYTALDFQRLAAVYDTAHPRARRKAT